MHIHIISEVVTESSMQLTRPAFIRHVFIWRSD